MEDLARVIQSSVEYPTKEEINDMISEVNGDENGIIDFEEFLNILARKMKVIIINMGIFEVQHCSFLLLLSKNLAKKSFFFKKKF